jgi:DNA-binding NarL/FixJ family response regulator
MNVQETSRSAYYDDAIPTLDERQKAVYDCLAARPEGMTNLEIAYALHRAINTITPRCQELRKLGLVQGMGRRACRHSGRTAIVWAVVGEAEQLSLLS